MRLSFLAYILPQMVEFHGDEWNGVRVERSGDSLANSSSSSNAGQDEDEGDGEDDESDGDPQQVTVPLTLCIAIMVG